MSGLILDEVTDGVDTVPADLLIGGQELYYTYCDSDDPTAAGYFDAFNISSFTDLGTAVYTLNLINAAAATYGYGDYGWGGSGDRPSYRSSAGVNGLSTANTYGTYDIGSSAITAGGSGVGAYGEYA